MVRQTLFKWTMVIGVGTTAVRSHSGGERLDSMPNTAWASGNLHSRSRVGVIGWKSTKRKHY